MGSLGRTVTRPYGASLLVVAILLTGPLAARDHESIVVVVTDVGEIEIALAPDAAPKAVARLLQLVEADSEETGSTESHYSDTSVDYAWPLVEIGVATKRAEADAVAIAQELDATSLGLDRQLVGDSGEAMDVWQFELSKADKLWKRDSSRPERYVDWLAEWEQQGSADFLIGESRKSLNEVLGYRYSTGLDSQPARRGAVYLKASSPTMASSGLVILLTDRPALDGRVTVVGQVTRGLEVADEISRRPVTVMGGKQTKIPADPVTVRTVRRVAETTRIDDEQGDR